MVERIDIGNVRGIKGDIGEKGDIGNTPTYDEIKYAKNEYGEYVTIQGKPPFIRCYEDSDMQLCDENGHLIVDGAVTNDTGTPFDEDEYGYLYKPIDKWLDSEGKFTNSNHELIDSEGDTIKVLSTFIGDILTYLFGDTVAYDKITGDIAPKVADSILSADPTDVRLKEFFDKLEGDVKYYVCEDNPELTIIKDGNSISNTCKYQDENGNIVLQENSNLPASVPLEKNTLYLYNGHEGADTNDIMHYDIYVCTKANTIPKKLVDSNDFRIDYNVIDDLKITVEEGQEEDEYDVYLNLYTKGDYGEFYNKTDIDNLFDEKVDDKLGVADGIAELGDDGKVKSSQLPTGLNDVEEISEIIDGKEDLSNKVVFLDNSDDHYPSSSAVERGLDALETKIDLKETTLNKVTTLDNSDTHYPTSNAVKQAISELNNDVMSVIKGLISLEVTTTTNQRYDEWGVDIIERTVTATIKANVVHLAYNIGLVKNNTRISKKTGYTEQINETITADLNPNMNDTAHYTYFVEIKAPNSNVYLFNEQYNA